MIPLRYDPAVHRIHDTPFAGFLRREFNDPLLVTYRHERTENWVVAAWTDGSKSKLLELAIMGKAPVGNPGIVASIRTLVRGNTKGEAQNQENRKILQTWEKNYNQGLNDEQDQVLDGDDYMAKRAGHQLTRGVRHVLVPG